MRATHPVIGAEAQIIMGWGGVCGVGGVCEGFLIKIQLKIKWKAASELP